MHVAVAEPGCQLLHFCLPLLAFAVCLLKAVRKEGDFLAHLFEYLGRFLLAEREGRERF